MTDITITVPISDVFREVSRRSVIISSTDVYYANKTVEERQNSQLQGEGDRITTDFTKEAAKEILKTYIPVQGDVSGLAFEYDLASSGNIVYRFSENDVPLSTFHTLAITTRLADNTKDAMIYFILASLYRSDGNVNKEQEMLIKYNDLLDVLSGDIYRLHS
jgi:hypothetical protein